ncbi:DUF805 domain-containing protein [Lactiplantibacillus daowaiensis]|uniref:DUF805 domain-containing protein n=1 Tax=Lactiplantibacillus daowaiensis TaxID=2559918 RepID=A0ABW1S214_9LACO|nr:DUF805 domain-containing protein [Lactiplantibacillus daowaiensis]
MTERFCTNCGQKLADNAQFCPNCGVAQPTASQDSTSTDQHTAGTDHNDDSRSTDDHQATSTQFVRDVPYNENDHPNLFASTGLFFKDCLNIQKRLGRADYWWAWLGLTILTILLTIAYGMFFASTFLYSDISFTSLVLPLFYWLFTLVAGFTAQVRRLHDLGYSGAFWLINFVPVVGNLAVLIMLCQPSRQAGNRYI